MEYCIQLQKVLCGMSWYLLVLWKVPFLTEGNKGVNYAAKPDTLFPRHVTQGVGCEIGCSDDLISVENHISVNIQRGCTTVHCIALQTKTHTKCKTVWYPWKSYQNSVFIISIVIGNRWQEWIRCCLLIARREGEFWDKGGQCGFSVCSWNCLDFTTYCTYHSVV